MGHVSFDVWEPVVAPYTELASEYIIGVAVAFIFGLALIYYAIRFFEAYCDCAVKRQIIGIALLVIGVPMVFAGLIGVSTVEYAAYVKRYGTFEQRYLEEVAPALERIQQAKERGVESYYDTGVVTKYVSDLVKADEAGKTEQPDPVYKSVAGKFLRSDTGECLVDLVDYDRLRRAVGLQDTLNKALMK